GLTAEHTLTWKKTAENTYTIAIASFTGTVEHTLTLNGDTFTADTGVKFSRAASSTGGSIITSTPDLDETCKHEYYPNPRK
ncbi:MAG TPA: hypothetical protein O0X39_00985, partial [Methanocorpusculum sp.]|nr:hypothetical protein [Methanocorpusculum sp.]